MGRATAYHGHGSRQTPQSKPVPGSSQVANSAGGFSFGVDKWTQLQRFLVLGSAGGTYYIGQAELTGDNVAALRACVEADGKRTVDTIVDISVAGRNVKQEPVIFALAFCAGEGDAETKRYALDKLTAVCRTGTHLFLFASYIEEFRGWGRALRRAVGRWYQMEGVEKLGYQVVKYRHRHDWTHRDLLRLSHPEAPSAEHARIYDFVAHGKFEAPLPDAVRAFEAAQVADKPADTVKVIDTYGGALPREAIKTEHLSHPDVNRALIDAGMPMTALIRNLGNLTRIGVLDSMGDYTTQVVAQITNAEAIKRSRVHPIQVLAALKTYQAGHGVRGTNTWTPVAKIVDALDDAFYLAFGNVEPTGKRICLALDVSGSMTHPVGGIDFLTCCDGAAAMALVTARTEPNNEIVAFADGNDYVVDTRGFYAMGTSMVPVALSPRQRLDDVIRLVDSIPMGGTDCALPMVDAMKHGKQFDAFVIYTDSETWAGAIHPVQALRQYREQMGIGAKLIVVGMAANPFSIADPDDPGSMDVVGFDPAAPQVISDFIAE